MNNFQNNPFSAAAGPFEQSFNSNGSAQTNSMGSSTTAIPATAPVPTAPRVQKRRGCQHCITCSGITHHFHSTLVR
jgi:hypothetical protein